MAYLNEIFNGGARVRPYGGKAPIPPLPFRGNGKGWGAGAPLWGQSPHTPFRGNGEGVGRGYARITPGKRFFAD